MCCIIDLINSIHRHELASADCVQAAEEKSPEAGAFHGLKNIGVKTNNDKNFLNNKILCCAKKGTCTMRE